MTDRDALIIIASVLCTFLGAGFVTLVVAAVVEGSLGLLAASLVPLGMGLFIGFDCKRLVGRS